MLLTTDKAVFKTGRKILAVPYCALQTVLSEKRFFCYTENICGIKARFYDTDFGIISTGYHPIGQELASDLYKKSEKAALEIKSNPSFSKAEKEKKINDIIENLFEIAFGGV